MDMVEKVARAIYEKRNGNGCKAWGSLPEAHKRPYLADADAAITVIGAPTAPMIENGVLAYNLTGIANGIINTAEDHVAYIFSAMLLGASSDAALSSTRRGMSEADANGWMPIESAPKDGTRVLVWRPKEGGVGAPLGDAHAGLDRWSGATWWHSRRYQQPTHWQPPPKPPVLAPLNDHTAGIEKTTTKEEV